MLRLILYRICMITLTFFSITILVFILIRLIPGDPIELMMNERGIDPKIHLLAIKNLGLDQPILHQYFKYITQVIKGDLGKSIITNDSILEEFLKRYPATIELSMFAILFSIIFGIPIGILSAVKKGKLIDNILMSFALIGYSMPIFWLAILFVMLFSVHLGLTPVSGRISIEYDIANITGFLLIDSLLSSETGSFRSALHHIILPSIILGTIPLSIIARITRSSMIDILSQDYIRTAKAKGLSDYRIIIIHAFRNALPPIITIIGLQINNLFSGAVLTETIFSWPGIGKWAIDSINRRDYLAVQGIVLIITLFVTFINIFVEIINNLINPRAYSKNN